MRPSVSAALRAAWIRRGPAAYGCAAASGTRRPLAPLPMSRIKIWLWSKIAFAKFGKS